MRKLYQNPFKGMNAVARLCMIITVILFLELIFLVLQALFVYVIMNFLKIYNFDVVKNNFQSFCYLYIEALILYLINFLFYLGLKLVAKFRTHYIDLNIALVILTLLSSPYLIKDTQWVNIQSPIAYTFLFVTIQFTIFSIATAICVRKPSLREKDRVKIAVAAAILLGFVVSWIVWLPLIAIYNG